MDLQMFTTLKNCSWIWKSSLFQAGVNDYKLTYYPPKYEISILANSAYLPRQNFGNDPLGYSYIGMENITEKKTIIQLRGFSHKWTLIYSIILRYVLAFEKIFADAKKCPRT